MTNDFAWLPNDIIFEVIETATYRNEGDLKSLASILGSWAERAERALANWRLRRTNILHESDVYDLKSLYEYVCIASPPKLFYGLLELMGTRFSSVRWYNYTILPEQASIQFVSFFQRQLKSTYLRKIYIEMNTKELHEQFSEFVKRPHFEELRLDNLDQLPFELFLGAHKAWEATERFQVRRKQIRSRISYETKQNFEKYFDIELVEGKSNQSSFRHPVHSTAKMNLKVYTSNDDWNVEMEFVDLQDEDEGEQDGSSFSNEDDENDDLHPSMFNGESSESDSDVQSDWTSESDSSSWSDSE